MSSSDSSERDEKLCKRATSSRRDGGEKSSHRRRALSVRGPVRRKSKDHLQPSPDSPKNRRGSPRGQAKESRASGRPSKRSRSITSHVEESHFRNYCRIKICRSPYVVERRTRKASSKDKLDGGWHHQERTRLNHDASNIYEERNNVPPWHNSRKPSNSTECYGSRSFFQRMPFECFRIVVAFTSLELFSNLSVTSRSLQRLLSGLEVARLRSLVEDLYLCGAATYVQLQAMLQVSDWNQTLSMVSWLSCGRLEAGLKRLRHTLTTLRQVWAWGVTHAIKSVPQIKPEEFELDEEDRELMAEGSHFPEISFNLEHVGRIW